MIEAEIMRLNEMNRTELQHMWREYFHAEPTAQNRKFYIYRLAYRLQELAYGGLDEDLRKKLLDFKSAKRQAKNKISPPMGTKLVRTYQGEEHMVLVLRDGFDFNGKYYKSLSGIALKITGHKISGNFFFGLSRKR